MTRLLEVPIEKVHIRGFISRHDDEFLICADIEGEEPGQYYISPEVRAVADQYKKEHGLTLPQVADVFNKSIPKVDPVASFTYQFPDKETFDGFMETFFGGDDE